MSLNQLAVFYLTPAASSPYVRINHISKHMTYLLDVSPLDETTYLQRLDAHKKAITHLNATKKCRHQNHDPHKLSSSSP